MFTHGGFANLGRFTSTVKVINKSNETIENFFITYDEIQQEDYTVKKIKPGKIKELSLITHKIPDGITLKMYVNEKNKYIVKESFKKNYSYVFKVYINDISSTGELDFEIVEDK